MPYSNRSLKRINTAGVEGPLILFLFLLLHLVKIPSVLVWVH